MSEGRFFEGEAKKRVRRAVKAIEAETAAEIVVAVRARSWRYRHTHFLFGFIVALVVLAGLLFSPWSFDIDFWPLEITVAFVAGVAFCMLVPPLERLLTAKSVMRAQVSRAAKAAFVDLGVTRTTGRSGLLVYVSLGERAAELVPDVGLSSACAAKTFAAAEAAIDRAVRRADFEAFVAGLNMLTKPLAEALPRRDDDENELADEVA